MHQGRPQRKWRPVQKKGSSVGQASTAKSNPSYRLLGQTCTQPSDVHCMYTCSHPLKWLKDVSITFSLEHLAKSLPSAASYMYLCLKQATRDSQVLMHAHV